MASGKGRFWEAESDDESDYSDESTGFTEDEEEEEEEGEQSGSEDEQGEDEADRKRSFFERYESDSDDEDRQVEVKNRKRKAIDSIASSGEKIFNALKNQDWGTVETEFDELMKNLARYMPTVFNDKTPMVFIKCFAELQDAAENAWADNDAKKKMAKQKLKSLTVVRQRLRKQAADYEDELEEYNKDPEQYAEDAEEQVRTFGEEDKEDDAEEGTEAKEDTTEGFDADSVNSENVETMLQRVINSRGRKKTNIATMIAILEKLVEFAPTTDLLVKSLLALISAIFDQRSMTNYLDIESWEIARGHIARLLDILQKNPRIEIEAPSALPSSTASSAAATPSGEAPVTVGGQTYLIATVASIIDRLDDEFTKSLQNIDPHTTNYLERLQHETKLYELIVRTQYFCEGAGNTDAAVRLIIRRVERMYYKLNTLNDKIENEVNKNLGRSDAPVDSIALMHSLCTFLYKNADDRIRTRALLFHVFHHALHNNYYKARDLLLMSHLQETIHNADIQSQVHYNRAMVQLGLCAFRHGLTKDAQFALQDIFNSGKHKELLAQGIMNRYGEKTPEQERLEKLRQMPFHMHINLELLECIYFTCSMLLEVPLMASATHDVRKKLSSKPFRRILDMNDKQILTGPPETTRDHIMQATKALMVGDWQLCNQMIHSIKIWNLLPNKDQILSMLTKKIQEESLRSFLFSYSPYYDSLSLDHLSEMFDMNVSRVHGIIAKMIINDEIHASIDQISNTVSIQHVEPTRLQYLALQYADKMSTSVEANEKMFELRTGSHGFSDSDRQHRSKQGMKSQYGGRDRDGKHDGRSQRGNRRGRGHNKFQGGQQRRQQNYRSSGPGSGSGSAPSRR